MARPEAPGGPSQLISCLISVPVADLRPRGRPDDAIKHPLAESKNGDFREYLVTNVEMEQFRVENVIQHGHKPLGWC